MSLIDHPPKGWVRALLRLPVRLFEVRLGWIFGDRLLLLHRTGRRSGRQYKTPLEVVVHCEQPPVWCVAAAWGERADWLQNLRSHPRSTVMVGRRVLPVVADILDVEQAADVYAEYARRRPLTAWVIGRVIGVDINQDSPRTLATRMPVVALRAATNDVGSATCTGAVPATAAAGEPAVSDVVAPVTTTRTQTRAVYDRIAPLYQLLEGLWGQAAVARGLAALDARPGESVLDVGCGPGFALVHLARDVQPHGRAVGVDLSLRMCEVASRRIRRAHLTAVAAVVESDAARLPFGSGSFDAGLMSFTLELFDTPEIPEVLSEIRRVLRVGGRIGVVALTRAGPASRGRRLYECAHERLPRLVDCRPIYPERSLTHAGFDVTTSHRVSLWGLPVDVVVAVNPSEAASMTAP